MVLIKGPHIIEGDKLNIRHPHHTIIDYSEPQTGLDNRHIVDREEASALLSTDKASVICSFGYFTPYKNKFLLVLCETENNLAPV